MSAENPNDVAPETTKLVDLSDKIEKAECYARNESSQFPMTNLFIGDSRLGCKSDADEQLIVHVAFNEFVKVSLSLGQLVENNLVLDWQTWKDQKDALYTSPPSSFFVYEMPGV